MTDPIRLAAERLLQQLELHAPLRLKQAKSDLLAALATSPTPPAEGEVAELVAQLGADAECVEAEHLAALPWQPIIDAPRDGTEILASDYDAIEIVSWDADNEWRTRDGLYFFACAWQHLPDHPGQE